MLRKCRAIVENEELENFVDSQLHYIHQLGIAPLTSEEH